MNETATRAIVAAGFVGSVFVLHIREITAEAELSAAGLLAAAAAAGIVVGYTYADNRNEDLTDLRKTVAQIREDQKRGAKQFEVVDAEEIDDDI